MQSTIRIAAAQSTSLPLALDRNVQIHLAFVASARALGVDVLVFPELSLCGYELPSMGRHIVGADDIRLAPLRTMAQETGMTIIVGAAVAGVAGALPAIGAILFGADGKAALYRKRHLHPGEERFVQAGTVDASCHHLHGQACALAVCADTSQPVHAAAAAAQGAALYLAGVLISESGYAADTARLQHYAGAFKMGVLMANHAAPSGGYVSAGRSAFWNPAGELVVAADGPGDCLVVADLNDGRWTGLVQAVDVAAELAR